MQPTLSICIPTCNRANQLARTLESIVSQEAFKSDRSVEIAISDNCSTDETAAVIQDYAMRYPDRIRALRLKDHVPFGKSFSAALQLGSGAFLKLHNDTLILKEGALKVMLATLASLPDRRVLPWFGNEDLDRPVVDCRHLDGYLGVVSFQMTWVGAFGVWRDDLERVRELFKRDETLIPHVLYLTETLARGRVIRVVSGKIFAVQPVQRKGGYNIAEVFGHNYLEILRAQVRAGRLSIRSYEHEKRRVLLQHINGFYFDFRNQYAFEKTGYFRWLWPYYRLNAYFYLALAALPFSWLGAKRKVLSMKFRAVLK